MFIDITPAAIDNASNRVRGIWKETRYSHGEGEGLWSWLQRITAYAIEHGEKLPSGKYRHAGIKFSILPIAKEHDGNYSQGYALQGIERVRE